MPVKNLNHLRMNIRNAFNEAQFKTVHTQGIKMLQGVLEKYTLDEFMEAFTACLKIPLSHGKKQVSVERTLDFAAKFCVSFVPEEEDEESESVDPVLNEIFQFIFSNHDVASEAVRFRVCQFANRLLASLPATAGLDNNLWNQLHSCMSERLKDKRPSVRAQAIMALQRLQDPTDKNCSVIQGLKFHLNKDPSAEVRLSALTTIATTNDTVMEVVMRTQDVSETVRRHAYGFLAEKVDVRILSIQHRERLLQAGLNDRSDIVRRFVKKTFLSKWLKSCNEDIFTLLASLDIINWTKDGLLEMVLKCLFNKFEIENLIGCIELDEPTKTVPLDHLSPERALYWRYMAQYLHEMDSANSSEKLEKVLPNLSPLCEYIRSYFSSWSNNESNEESMSENLERKFILKQLMEITKLYDYSDETGRTNLKELLVDLLLSNLVEVHNVPTIVSTLEKVIPKTADYIELISDLVEKIHCPSLAQKRPLPEREVRERKIKKAKIRLEINEERERQENAIQAKDFLLAQSIKESLSKLESQLETLDFDSFVEIAAPKEQNDPATLLKCLEIIINMLQVPSIRSITPTLTNLREDFVMKCIAVTDNYTIHSKSLEALALFCLLDQELAKSQFVFFFCVICRTTDEDVELGVSALKAIFDILCLYGLESFDVTDMPEDLDDKENDVSRRRDVIFDSASTDDLEDESSGNVGSGSHKEKKNVNLISILTSLLDHKHSKMRSVAVEGLCKLLFLSKIVSPELLSRLVLMWYTPISGVEHENYFHQLMGTFFPSFAMQCEGAQESLASASLIALRTLVDAPDISPLATVDLMSVANFFLDLTRPGVSRVEPEVNMHNHMGIAFCQEVFENCDNIMLQTVLIRSLTLMEISLDDPVKKQQYSALHGKLLKFISDKICLRYLKKFYLKIQLNESVSDDLEKSSEREGGGVASDEEDENLPVMGPQRVSVLLKQQQKMQDKIPDVTMVGPSDESDEDDDDFLETAKTKIPETPESRNGSYRSLDDFEMTTPAISRKRKQVRRRRPS